MKILSKRLVVMFIIIAVLLLIPFIAMQFTQEVQWSLSDFLIMGAVLVVIALAYEWIARRSEKAAYRAAVGVGLAGAFLLFWVNAAVGIIGNEGQSANLLFGVVYIVVFGGALISGLRPRGMATTLFMAAVTQMLVPAAALIFWPPPATSWSPGIFGVFYMSSFFAILFLISGMLFRRAALQDRKEKSNYHRQGQIPYI